MSLDTLNNGDSGLEARTKINAAIAAVDSGTIIRATGQLQAYTVGETFPTPPPVLNVSFSNADPETFTVSIEVNGVTKTVAFGSSDPGGVDAFIDSSSFASPADYAGALNSTLAGLGVSSSYPGYGGIVETSNADAGSGATISGSTLGSGNVGVEGGGSGADGIPAHGATMSVVLIPGVAGKKIRLIGAWGAGSIVGGVTAGLFLSSYGPISDERDMSSSGVFSPLAFDAWINGYAEGESLSVFYMSGSLPEDGSQFAVGVIAEQY